MRKRLAVLAGLTATLALVSGSGAGRAAADACPTTNAPNEFVLNGGSGQMAQLGTKFGTSLSVKLANTNGCSLTGNLAGYDVEFDAPNGGPSGTFAGSGSTSVIVGTDASGAATAPAFTANDTAGAYTVDVHSDFATVELYLVNTAAGLAAEITATSGTGQQAALNSLYPQPLQARVTDADGNPVQGATVSFTVVPGASGAGGSFLGGGQASATTDANGYATSPPLLANASAGSFGATASVAGLSTVAGYALDNHASGTTVAATGAQSLTAAVHTRYRSRLQARVLDASGKPIEGASVTFAIAAGSASGSGGGAGASFVGGGAQATEVTDATGEATSPPLLANTTAGDFTATATSSGAQPVDYSLRNLAGKPYTIAAGAASGESTTAGSRFPIRLAVTVEDAYGNDVPGAAVTFRAPARGPSGRFPGRRTARAGTSLVARARTNADGIAVAPPFAGDRTPGGYIVRATVAGSGAHAAFALVNLSRGEG